MLDRYASLNMKKAKQKPTKTLTISTQHKLLKKAESPYQIHFELRPGFCTIVTDGVFDI